ncbi:MAG: methyltransferase domain-containing protein [Elusimicrobia bacterium]|nr:methyltransferase domain-containing protein [Elusimicrobiota bacterium]MBD3411481.1 methyltransferase domain-containing protein [Elusimicrobiota bacterium]
MIQYDQELLSVISSSGKSQLYRTHTNIFSYDAPILLHCPLPQTMVLFSSSSGPPVEELEKLLTDRNCNVITASYNKPHYMQLRALQKYRHVLYSGKRSLLAKIMLFIQVRILNAKKLYVYYCEKHTYRLFAIDRDYIITSIFQLLLALFSKKKQAKRIIPGFNVLLNFIEKQTNLLKQHTFRVFDYGCGNGRVSEKLSKYHINLLGIDPIMSDTWKKHQEHVFIRADEKILSHMISGSFDLCTVILVLMYAYNYTEILTHCIRVLKPGGIIYIQEPNAETLRYRLFKKYFLNEPFTKQYFTEKNLTAILNNSSLTVLKIWYESFYAPVFPNLIDTVMPRALKSYIERRIPEKQLSAVNIIAQKPYEK